MLLSQWRSNGRHDYGIGARRKAPVKVLIMQINKSYKVSFPYPEPTAEPIYVRVGYVFESRFSAGMIYITDFYDFWHP